MKSARYVMGFITLLFLAIAIWMNTSRFIVSGGVVGRFGNLHGSTVTPSGMIFLTAVMGAIWGAIVWTQNKDRRSR